MLFGLLCFQAIARQTEEAEQLFTLKIIINITLLATMVDSLLDKIREKFKQHSLEVLLLKELKEPVYQLMLHKLSALTVERSKVRI